MSGAGEQKEVKRVFGPEVPPHTKKSKPSGSEETIVIYQLTGGDVQAHVMQIEAEMTEDAMQKRACQFYAEMAKRGWTVSSQLCIYTFVCMSAKVVKNFIYTSDPTKRERLSAIVENPVETNRVVSDLIRAHDGMVVRVVIVQQKGGAFAMSAHLNKVSIGHLRAMIPTSVPSG